VAVMLGGAAAVQDSERLSALGAQVMDSMSELRLALRRMSS
jgi:hypothetical protein